MSCVGHRLGSGPVLLWLWRRPEATAPIRPLAWESPYAAGAAQEIAKKTKKKKPGGVPIMAQQLQTQQVSMRTQVWSLALLSGLRIQHCCELCGVGQRCGLDPELLWLWRRPAATALIRPLAWEPPYSMCVSPPKRRKTFDI